MLTDSNITRRSFISGGAALAATASSVVSATRAAERRLRMALVGTGARGSFTWGQDVVEDYSDVVEIVGLCDINHKRVEAAKKLIGTTAPSFVDFDRMIKETHPDTVMITTVDATHARYIVRALELGCDVMTEKPLCTDEEQCVSILDTSHGADYFRRWHRLKQNSGTLLVHKASHHFDLANWWLDSTPVEVTAFGDLKFYGRTNSFRSTHCRVCPFKQQCKFYWDVTQNQDYVKLYVDCESEDGYLRDGCVWREDINIYDTMSVVVKYENGVFLNYTANTYLPFEGQAISINGRTGRLDYNEFGGGGFGNKGLRLTRSFGKSEVIQDLEALRAGGHGGADTSLHDLIFRGSQGSDPLGLRADLRAGARASLIGIAAYRSIERGGQTIRIKDLVKL